MGIHRSLLSDISPLGLYTWDVCANKLIGDPEFASIHGLSAEKVARGLSIEFIIGRIVDGDRERTAREVHTAILSGEFISSAFQIKTEAGEIRTVGWYGRCLRDAEGVPTQFTGAAFDYTIGDIVLSSARGLHVH